MSDEIALVVTTINQPTQALEAAVSGAVAAGWRSYVVGDRKSPPGFRLEGACYLDLAAQRSAWPFARHCPENHYARKNVGYLQAIAGGASVLVETDDDNAPLPGFFSGRRRCRTARLVGKDDWVNAYAFFTDARVWPRGLPLDVVRAAPPDVIGSEESDCPIQQGLADGDPDVDAVYRLVSGAPVVFRAAPHLALAAGSACPFNSQNTTWWRDAFALLYLPAHCSFRMTDIWRAFVAQRIAWARGWRLLFHAATVRQDRNPHDSMKDFEEEIVGYRRNREFMAVLRGVPLAGDETVGSALVRCYGALAAARFFPHEELALLDAWLADLAVALKAGRP